MSTILGACLNNVQLLYQPGPLSFDQSRTFCQQFSPFPGGDLAVFNDAAEFAVIRNFYLANRANPLSAGWIGLFDPLETSGTDPSRFQFVDNSDTSFIQVGPAEFPWRSSTNDNNPNNVGGNQHCVRFEDPDDLLDDRVCSEGHDAICQVPCDLTFSPTLSPTLEPSISPTQQPTENPTEEPTLNPTANPTINPTVNPTVSPTEQPTEIPSRAPTLSPTDGLLQCSRRTIGISNPGKFL